MPAAPIVFGREFFEVDPRSTALIVIDMQNAFVAEGSTYETPKNQEVIRRRKKSPFGQGDFTVWSLEKIRLLRMPLLQFSIRPFRLFQGCSILIRWT